jgi:hypothetical protein
VLGFIATLIILDLHLRFTEIITPGSTVINPSIGPLTRKNKNVTTFNEGFFIGKTNEYGYWGPGYPPYRKKGTIRVALIGDSYIEGLQVFDRDHLRSIIENKLKQELDSEVEVLKIGYSGLNIESMYCYFNKLALKFKPDFTLFFIKNPDVFHLQSISYYPSLILDTARNKLKIIPISLNDKVVKNKLFFQNYAGILYTFTLIKNAFSLVQKGEGMHILLDKLYPRKELTEAKILTNNNKISLKVKFILKELGDIENVGFVNLGQLDKSFVDELHNVNIPYIDPISTLSNDQKKEFSFWKATKTSGHWNQKGHRFIGSFIAEKLQPLIEDD